MRPLALLLSASLAAPGPAAAQFRFAPAPGPARPLSAPLAPLSAPAAPGAALLSAPPAATALPGLRAAPLPALRPLAAPAERAQAAPRAGASQGALRSVAPLQRAGSARTGPAPRLGRVFDGQGERAAGSVRAFSAAPLRAAPETGSPARPSLAELQAGDALPRPGLRQRAGRAWLAAAAAAYGLLASAPAWARPPTDDLPRVSGGHAAEGSWWPFGIFLAVTGVFVAASMIKSVRERRLLEKAAAEPRGLGDGTAAEERAAAKPRRRWWPFRSASERALEKIEAELAADEKGRQDALKAKLAKGPRLEDVAGQDEAKAELLKVVDFLKNPESYRKVGAKAPTGVLLFGPPGTGKTMLAKATANEGGAAFFMKEGSNFVNRFVGVGADAVRDLFAKAKAVKGPALIFFDEIDALAAKRAEDGSGNREYEQTLNQLLVEISALEEHPHPVVLIAATNRPEMLDPALLRGKRFELKVPVGLPDVKGREAVLAVQAREVPLAEDADLGEVARQTPGLSGADLAAIVNDAALMAGRRRAEKVAMEDLRQAVDRALIGHSRRRVMSPKERRVVAYHEAGHALASHHLPNADPVRVVTIVPHGLQALGLVQAMPEEERSLYSREWLLDRMAVALAGRAAERLSSGTSFSGAANDLEQATRIARMMVMKYGMSEKVGHVSFDMPGERPVVGQALSTRTRLLIDEEVRALVEEAHRRAQDLLAEKRAELDRVAEELLRVETIRDLGAFLDSPPAGT